MARSSAAALFFQTARFIKRGNGNDTFYIDRNYSSRISDPVHSYSSGGMDHRKVCADEKDISSLRLIQGVFRFILKIAGTRITVIGEENVPKDTPVLYIGNHRSYFDILLTYTRCVRRTGYIAKKRWNGILFSPTG